VFSEAIYKGQNVAKRCVGRLKQNRRRSTRHEMLAVHYLSVIKLALIYEYLRLIEPSNTT
jgi:transposase